MGLFFSALVVAEQTKTVAAAPAIAKETVLLQVWKSTIIYCLTKPVDSARDVVSNRTVIMVRYSTLKLQRAHFYWTW